MFDKRKVAEDVIKELNFEREEEAKRAIKEGLREIIRQQNVIAEASAKISEIQEKIKAISVSKVEVNISL